MCLCSVLVEDSKEAEELKSAYLDYRRLKESKMKTTIVMRRSMRNFNTPPREFLWEFALEHRSIQIIPRSSQNCVKTSYLKYLPKRQI